MSEEVMLESPAINSLPTEETNIKLKKGNLILFNLRGKVRTGKVISKGNKFIGIDTLDLKSNTKIPNSNNLIPITVFVDKEILAKLES